MADAIVSLVIEQLTSLIIDEVKQQVKLVVGVKQELEKLKSNLLAIRGLLAHAEQKQLKDLDVKHWLDRLKDVAYDMEDVVDEWNTARLKLQIEGGDDHNSASKPTKRRVLSFLPSCCSSFQEVGLRQDIATKIKDLNETLNDIKIQKDMFNFEVNKGEAKQPERRGATSSFATPEMLHREKERKKIKDLLLSGSSQLSTIRTISLVGMGGIGKTTLARSVFDDKEVKAYFRGQTIWVSVSKPFDSTRIAKAILKSLKDGDRIPDELQQILSQIQEVIRGTKFLLILDDVWEDGPDMWGELKSSLLECSPESKILVTTRNVPVAIKMECTRDDMCHIRKLSPEECWSIFSKLAFFDKDSNERGRLEAIGRKIVDKCDGLPLAVKSLGSLLQTKRSVEQWMRVLNSELWDIPEIWKAQTSLASLWLSYYDLPSEWKQCFSYCAIFPEDYTFRKDELTAIWMAQGYLGTASTTKIAMETYGEEYFESLVERCFFEEFSYYGGYKMHDVLRDFAQYLRMKECFSMEIKNSAEPTEPPALPTEARHLGIVLGREASWPSFISRLEKLRTFRIQSDGYRNKISGADLSSLFDKLSCLRSLILRGCGITEIPPSITKLVHLRQLDLSNNFYLRRLPEYVCELYNLQTLNVRSCSNLELPENIEKLSNLRHLDNYWTDDVIPKGIRRLTNLRTLGQFVFYGGEDEANCTIGDLKNLKNLQGDLWIRGIRNASGKEVRGAQLNQMSQITGWFLDFDGCLTEQAKHHDEKLIEALQPSPNVERLDIREYEGVKFFPSWLMSLNNLKYISFQGRRCEYLAPLWKLPALETLLLLSMSAIPRLGVWFVGKETQADISSSSSSSSVAFPKLKTLAIDIMRELQEWESVMVDEVPSNFFIMPNLRRLQLYFCPTLKALPNYIYQSKTLEEFVIYKCPYVEKLCQEAENGGQKIWASPNLIIHYGPEQAI